LLKPTGYLASWLAGAGEELTGGSLSLATNVEVKKSASGNRSGDWLQTRVPLRVTVGLAREGYFSYPTISR
jgi:hypothetical protein